MRKNKILAIDDNPVNLGILEEALCGEFQIRFAQNGIEALRIAEQFQPHFILLDVMMPGMDGLEICRELRKKVTLSDTIIIMVSAKAMPSEQAAGIRAGADDYITKPFDEVELVETLRQYTAASPAAVDSVAVESPEESVRAVY